MTDELGADVLDYLRHAKLTLVLIIAMNRAERRRAGWTKPKRVYQQQLMHVLRDLGEIA